MLAADTSLLRMFIGESDRYEKQPLYEWIIVQAKAKGLAGATALRGSLGFGADTRIIHTFKIERVSQDLPIIIEVVDTTDKVEDFLSFVEKQIPTRLLATLQKVEGRFIQVDRSCAPTTPPQ